MGERVQWAAQRRSKALQRWRSDVSIGIVVWENADAAVKAGQMRAPERERLKDRLKQLWDHPPCEVSDAELGELFVRSGAQRLRYARRFESSWESGSIFEKLGQLAEASYRRQISDWTDEGWLTEFRAQRLRDLLDSKAVDGFVHVQQALERSQQASELDIPVATPRNLLSGPTLSLLR